MKLRSKQGPGRGERGWFAWAVLAALALVLLAVIQALFSFMLLD